MLIRRSTAHGRNDDLSHLDNLLCDGGVGSPGSMAPLTQRSNATPLRVTLKTVQGTFIGYSLSVHSSQGMVVWRSLRQD